ncbi:MAG: Fe-S-containing protein [Desulfuromonadales bacterium]|nr:Fe-S-containing protein [Desulfuromonadales bacterium]MDW7757572.1 Fe-S-containing protein [Desulfuromonadales bacterium]
MTEQDKKQQFEQPAQNKLPRLVIILTILVALAAAAWTVIPGDAAGSKLLKAEGGLVQIDQADLADGQARYYRVQGAENEINFFLVQSQDGEIRSAFDTCDVCFRAQKGYRQEGDSMICNNCNQAFKTELVGVIKGGCNPAPLAKELRDGKVIISLADLEQGSWYFAAQPQKRSM